MRDLTLPKGLTFGLVLCLWIELPAASGPKSARVYCGYRPGATRVTPPSRQDDGNVRAPALSRAVCVVVQVVAVGRVRRWSFYRQRSVSARQKKTKQHQTKPTKTNKQKQKQKTQNPSQPQHPNPLLKKKQEKTQKNTKNTTTTTKSEKKKTKNKERKNDNCNSAMTDSFRMRLVVTCADNISAVQHEKRECRVKCALYTQSQRRLTGRN